MYAEVKQQLYIWVSRGHIMIMLLYLIKEIDEKFLTFT